MKTNKENHFLLCDDKGFTLLEFIIAIAIFSIGLLAAATMQISAVQTNKNGNIRTQAMMLAHARIEALSEEDVTTLVNSTENDIRVGNRSTPYTRMTAVSNLTPPREFARRVTVTVSWDSPGMHYRNVSLTSYVTGDGE